jgi:hypothetical protein
MKSTAELPKTLSNVAESDWQRRAKDHASQREIGKSSNRYLPKRRVTERAQRKTFLRKSLMGLGTPMPTKGHFLMAL